MMRYLKYTTCLICLSILNITWANCVMSKGAKLKLYGSVAKYENNTWFLLLDKPQCFLPDGEVLRQIVSARRIQLIIPSRKFKLSHGKKYMIHGKSFVGTANVHSSKVLINVEYAEAAN